MKAILKQILARENLSQQQAYEVFSKVMAGEVDAPTLGAMLCGLSSKGEHVNELVGAARAMREAASHVHCDRPSLDTCGTGGDGINTFNVSTTAALIASAAGAVVAKHGNRTNTRVSGSAEVLDNLGVNIEADVPKLEKCLAEIDIAFLYALRLHPAMKYAAPVRKALGVRTIFNLLGPLSNPAGAQYQILGVSREKHIDLLADALLELGAKRAWVVHGTDGLCDLTITGTTRIAEIKDGTITRFDLDPADAGLTKGTLADLTVGSAKESAEVVKNILSGKTGPSRDHAVLNAAAALVVYGLAEDIHSGAELATKTIDSGAAQDKLNALVRLSNETD